MEPADRFPLSYWRSFVAAPALFRAYLIFALIATALGLSGIAELWSYYAWSLLFALPAVARVEAKTPLHAIPALWSQRLGVYAAVVFLALGMAFGIQDVARNPVSLPLLRPLVTIALPAAWIVALLSPGMRRWAGNPFTMRARMRALVHERHE